MNPQVIEQKKRIDKDKISRVFSRIAVFPFEQVSEAQTMLGSLDLKAALRPFFEKMVLIFSVGTLLELQYCFENMQEDDLFLDMSSLLQNSAMDIRTQLNYALVLFSTGKILEKLSLKDRYFPSVKEAFVKK